MSYGTVDMNAMNESSKEDRFFYSVPQTGDKVFFCPPWKAGLNIPFHETYIHFNIIEKERVLCLKAAGQPVCPICEIANELRNMKNNPAAQSLNMDIYARKYNIYGVIPQVDIQMPQVQGQQAILYPSNSQYPPRIRPFLVGKKLQTQIMQIFSMFGNIFDPTNGNLLVLQKMQNSDDKKFAETFAQAYPQKIKLHDTLMALLSNMPDLSTVIKPLDFNHLKAVADHKMVPFRHNTVTVPALPSVASIPQQTQFAQVQMPQMPQMPSAQVQMPPPPANIGAQGAVATPSTPVMMPQVPAMLTPTVLPQSTNQSLDSMEAFLKAKQQQGN